jgi:hypothetical protein
MVPFYVFDRAHMEDLRVGTHCLKEALYTETNKKETEELDKRKETANKLAAITKVNRTHNAQTPRCIRS